MVGRVGVGDAVLDMNVLGQWRRCAAQRPSQFVLYPRVAGALVRRLEITVDEGNLRRTLAPGSEYERETSWAEGYVEAEPGATLRLPVLPGSYMYSAPAGGVGVSGRGALYRVVLPKGQVRGVRGRW